MANLSWQLARRYRATRHTSGFIRFISAASTLGIALGVAVLILMLSVMNGFEQALQQRLLSVIPHVELEAVQQPITDWQRKLDVFRQQENISGAAPYVKSNGMLRRGAQVKAAQIKGIELAKERQISDFADYLLAGQLQSLSAGDIILGKGVAEALQVEIGDSIQLLLPKISEDGRLTSHSSINLQVSAIIAVGGQLDYSQVWVDMSALANWLTLPQDGIHGFAFRLHNVFDAPLAARQLGNLSDDYVYLLDWVRTQGHIYRDIQMIRAILYLVLTLVMLVASFNIVATLVMAVREKENDIAILLTMGARPKQIITTFVWLGWLNGLTGVSFGIMAGVLLSWYIAPVFNWFAQLSGKSLLDPSIYFIDYIPSLLQWQDVAITAFIAIIMSLLATLYPAYRASKVQPASVLG